MADSTNMVLDPYLSVPDFCKKLIWINVIN